VRALMPCTHVHSLTSPLAHKSTVRALAWAVDRGCMLDWISQYTEEAEVLFAPLTGIEVQTTRTEGSVLVVEARLSVNLNALTLEQVTLPACSPRSEPPHAHPEQPRGWSRYGHISARASTLNTAAPRPGPRQTRPILLHSLSPCRALSSRHPVDPTPRVISTRASNPSR
jgi:hypothetical protein